MKKPESDFKKYLKIRENLWREIQNDTLVKPMYEKTEKETLRENELLTMHKKPRAMKNTQYNNNYSSQRAYGLSSNNGTNYDVKSQYVAR